MINYHLSTGQTKYLKELNGFCTSTDNHAGIAEFDYLTQDQIETVINTTRRTYIDGTPTSGTRDVSFANIDRLRNIYGRCRGTILIRNNYEFPVHVHVYLVKPKTDTDLSFKNCFTNGMTDNGLTYASDTTIPIQLWPRNVKLVKENYKVISRHRYFLRPGDELKEEFVKKFYYNYDMKDNESTAFRKNHYRGFFVRINGVVSHDSEATPNIGIREAKVDMVGFQNWDVFYPDVGNVYSISDNGGLGTLVNGVVVHDKVEGSNTIGGDGN